MQHRVADTSARIDGLKKRQFALGFEAHVVQSIAGAIELNPLSNHFICMHLGPPVTAKSRCEGRRARRVHNPGDIDILPIGYPMLWEDDGPARILRIALSPVYVQQAARRMNVDYSQIALRPQFEVRDPHLQHLCRAILVSLDDSDEASAVYAESLALALAAHLIRTSLANQSERGRLARRDVNHVLDYIADNLDRDLSLDKLASIAGLSTSHFKIVFRKMVGTPAHRYVVQKRVEAAVHLLENGMAPLQVAMQAGFANQSHMARLMKRTIGITPKDVR
jgi:AraC family transcriptional regulator